MGNLKLHFKNFPLQLKNLKTNQNTSEQIKTHQNTPTFGQKQPIKVQIFRLSSARVRIHQIPHFIFEATSQFFFKFCITLQCHDT